MFTHHSLFSKENVLVMRLMQQYKSYLQRMQENMAEYYGHKVNDIATGTLGSLPPPKHWSLVRKRVV